MLDQSRVIGKKTIYFFFCLLASLSCSKDVGIITEVEFVLSENHQKEGFTNEPLISTFTVTPEAILEDYNYSMSYSINNESGSYFTYDGEKISQTTSLPMDNLSVSLNFQASKAGTYQVKITAVDNFGATKQLDLTYTVNNVPVNWTATSTTAQYVIADSAPISLTLENDSELKSLAYEWRYRIQSGSGELTNASNNTIAPNSFMPTTPGVYQLSFIPDALGTVILQFDLKDSDGQELSTEVKFEVVPEILDETPPTITILGDNPLQLFVGNTYVEMGATALDDIDGDISDTINIDDSNLDVNTPESYVVVYTVADLAGNSVSDTRTVNVVSDTDVNQAPLAKDDNFSINENDTLSQTVFADNGNGRDSDPDGDIITVIQVNNAAENVGVPIAGSNGGLFTINAEGNLIFDTNEDFESLSSGDTKQTNITYQLSDGTANSSTATVAVTVNGISSENQKPNAVAKAIPLMMLV